MLRIYFSCNDSYMATYVIDSFQAKEYDLVVCTLFLVSCSVALTIVTGKSYTLTEQGIRHKFWGYVTALRRGAM